MPRSVGDQRPYRTPEVAILLAALSFKFSNEPVFKNGLRVLIFLPLLLWVDVVTQAKLVGLDNGSRRMGLGFVGAGGTSCGIQSAQLKGSQYRVCEGIMSVASV